MIDGIDAISSSSTLRQMTRYRRVTLRFKHSCLSLVATLHRFYAFLVPPLGRDLGLEMPSLSTDAGLHECIPIVSHAGQMCVVDVWNEDCPSGTPLKLCSHLLYSSYKFHVIKLSRCTMSNERSEEDISTVDEMRAELKKKK